MFAHKHPVSLCLRGSGTFNRSVQTSNSLFRLRFNTGPEHFIRFLTVTEALSPGFNVLMELACVVHRFVPESDRPVDV